LDAVEERPEGVAFQRALGPVRVVLDTEHELAEADPDNLSPRLRGQGLGSLRLGGRGEIQLFLALHVFFHQSPPVKHGAGPVVDRESRARQKTRSMTTRSCRFVKTSKFSFHPF